MKKQGIYILVLLTGLFAALVTGVFLGRNMNRQSLSVDHLRAETGSDQMAAVAGAADPAPAETNAAPTAGGRVDINTATLAELTSLPGIGETLARRIMDYREANGPFSSVSELLKVSGIGQRKLEGLLDHITAGG